MKRTLKANVGPKQQQRRAKVLADGLMQLNDQALGFVIDAPDNSHDFPDLPARPHNSLDLPDLPAESDAGLAHHLLESDLFPRYESVMSEEFHEENFDILLGISLFTERIKVKKLTILHICRLTIVRDMR